MTRRFFDMHCHVDFAPQAQALAADAAAEGCGMLCTTVEPSGFERARIRFADSPNVRVAAGLHPWWLSRGQCGQNDAEAAVNLAARVPYVGEVGLDFSAKCEASKPAQVDAFRHIATTSALVGGKVLSIHAVKSAAAVLDILEGTGALRRNACIFHWFSGTSDELHRALRAGCYISVNHMMLSTRKGCEYARQLPIGRLLLETDHPGNYGDAFTWPEQRACLEAALGMVAEVRKVDPDDLAETIFQTSIALVGSIPASGSMSGAGVCEDGE